MNKKYFSTKIPSQTEYIWCIKLKDEIICVCKHKNIAIEICKLLNKE